MSQTRDSFFRLDLDNLGILGDGGSAGADVSPCFSHPILPQSAGLSFGASADAGTGIAGVSAGASAGGGNLNRGSFGAFASGGAAAYAGSMSASTSRGAAPGVLGLSAAAGFSLYVTNAQSAQQLAGPFTTYTGIAGFGPVQLGGSLSVGGGIYQLSISPPFAGVALGVSGSRITNSTRASPGCH